MTRRQEEELLALARQPQNTYGKGRARVQNTLLRMGLATYPVWHRCEITEAGRVVAESIRRRDPAAAPPPSAGTREPGR